MPTAPATAEWVNEGPHLLLRLWHPAFAQTTASATRTISLGLLPRIPEVATAASTFRAFSEAGQRLLELHIGYEAAAPYPLEERLAPRAPAGPDRYRVLKMRWGGPSTRTPDHSIIVYNDWITLAGIPDEAHEYLVGPRSALAWLLDRYRVTTDGASGIVNDPNDWGVGDRRSLATSSIW